MKNERITVPTTFLAEMKSIIQQGHLGIKSCKKTRKGITKGITILATNEQWNLSHVPYASSLKTANQLSQSLTTQFHTKRGQKQL